MSLANLWKFFHHGLVQNTPHKQAFCKGHVTYYLHQASFKAEISEGLEPATSFQAEQKPFDDGLSDFS